MLEPEQREATHGPIKRSYRIGKEQRVNQIYLGQLAANSKCLEGDARSTFITEWLGETLPETVLPTSGMA
jgi:hypothetical protein